jgi:hypothetical protein
MSDIEKLEAAIAKLEAERVASAQGEWMMRWTLGIPTWPTIIVEGAGPVVDTTDHAWYPPANAELIVTLHRTIDAQLDFLRFARGVAGARLTGEQAELIVGFGIEFAEAILGSDS